MQCFPFDYILSGGQKAYETELGSHNTKTFYWTTAHNNHKNNAILFGYLLQPLATLFY